MWFLTTFLIPRDENNIPVKSTKEWTAHLNETPFDVTAKFLQDGLIEHASPAVKLNYQFKVEELRQLLRDRDLSTTGNKSDLVYRLTINCYDEVKELTEDIVLLQCSDIGEKIVEEFFQTLQNLPQSKFNKLPRISGMAKEDLQSLLLWISTAAISGIIGNRADEIILEIYKKFKDNLDVTVQPPEPVERGDWLRLAQSERERERLHFSPKENNLKDSRESKLESEGELSISSYTQTLLVALTLKFWTHREDIRDWYGDNDELTTRDLLVLEIVHEALIKIIDELSSSAEINSSNYIEPSENHIGPYDRIDTTGHSVLPFEPFPYFDSYGDVGGFDD